MAFLCYISARFRTTGRRRFAYGAYALLVLFALVSIAGLPAAADERCETCHPKETSAYRKTGMGRSMGRPTGQNSGSFAHAASGSFFSVSATEETLSHSLRRGGIEARYTIDFSIGSGNAAIGYLLRIGDRLYQSPVTFYAETGRFGIAPGMEKLTDPDFLRPVAAECVWCHAGKPRPIPHSLNRFEDPAFEIEAISCERCHGSPEAHLLRPSRETILNPAELPARQRDSICEQCHLSGRQRVLNPGRSFGDFQPGMVLEEVLTVFVSGQDSADGGGGEPFQVVSHSERLALSRCFGESGGKMWCGTCHSPHEDAEDQRASYIRKCESCHDELAGAGHGEPSGDCVACHLTRRQSRDSGHSSFTDHLISPRPVDSLEKAGREPGQGPPLRPWREPLSGLRDRNLGIAQMREAEKTGSRGEIEQAFRLLSAAARRFPDDADILGGLGMALMLSGRHREGVQKLEQAIAAEPANPLRYPPAAAAWWQTGDDQKAMDILGAAIEADPHYFPAYRMRAHILLEQGRAEEARETWEKFLQYVPQSVNARLALRAPAGATGPKRDER